MISNVFWSFFRIINRFSILILSVYASSTPADDIVVEAKCSPVIGKNVGIIYINCAGIDKETQNKINKILSELDEVKIYQASVANLQTLIDEANRLHNDKILRGDIKTHKNIEDIMKLEEQIENLEYDFDRRWEDHINYRDALNDALTTFEKNIDAEWEIKSQYWIDKQLTKRDKILRKEFDQTITDIEKRLTELEFEVVALKTDVSYLMNQYLLGDYPKKIGFFGVSLGTLNIDSDWHPKYSIEYEVLFPEMPITSSRGSVFIEVAGVDWENTLILPTLPGIEQSKITENNDVNYYALGAKLFVANIVKKYPLSTGVSFGNSFGDGEDTAYIGVIIGAEHYRRGSRIILEFRYDYYTNIEQTFITFDPFGDPLVETTAGSKDGIFLGIKFMFR